MEAIDPALRRSGRFDAEIEVTTPTEDERFHILKVRCDLFLVFHLSDKFSVVFIRNGNIKP